MRILLLEDNEELRGLIARELRLEGYEVLESGEGEEGLYYMEENAADMAVVDRMLPGMDGLTVLREARKKGLSLPVLLLTALGSVDDRVDGLEAGADDYLAKPFDMRELLARLRALQRRPATMESAEEASAFDVTLTLPEYRLRGPAGECVLSRKEGALLERFLRHPGQVLTREALFSRVWGVETDAEAGNLDSYVYFLRRRLEIVGSKARIANQRGVGFRMEEA